MRRTKEEAEQTRQDLIDAALTLFSKNGYHATRLGDIAKATGVTRGAIYHHFGNKAELYKAMVEDVSAQFGQVVGQAIGQGGTFAEVGARVLVNTWVFLETTPRIREMTELFYYKTGDTPELAEITQLRKDDAIATTNMLAGYMRQAIADGELPETLDPENGARAFLAFQNGMGAFWLANKEAFSLKDNAETLAKIFIDGLLAQ